MRTFPRLEIHGQKPDGTKYILQHMHADNDEVRSATNPDAAFSKLKDVATMKVMRWQSYLPNDKIFVTEV